MKIAQEEKLHQVTVSGVMYGPIPANPKSMTVTILYFARARELTSKSSETISIQTHAESLRQHIKLFSIKQLLGLLFSRYPQLNLIKNSLMVALNGNYIELDDDDSSFGVVFEGEKAKGGKEDVRIQEGQSYKDCYIKDGDEIAIIPPLSGG